MILVGACRGETWPTQSLNSNLKKHLFREDAVPGHVRDAREKFQSRIFPIHENIWGTQVVEFHK